MNHILKGKLKEGRNIGLKTKLEIKMDCNKFLM